MKRSAAHAQRRSPASSTTPISIRAQAMRDLGYRPLGVRAGFAALFPALQPATGAPAHEKDAHHEACADPRRVPFARLCLVDLAAWAAAAAPPRGGGRRPAAKRSPTRRRAPMEAGRRKAKGTIVWSSSRLGNHDLFTMNTDGTQRQAHHAGRRGRLVPALLARRQPNPLLPQQEGLGQRARRQQQRKWDIYTVDARRHERERRSSTTPAGAAGSRTDEIVFVRGDRRSFARKLGDGRRPSSWTARRCPSSTARSCSSRRCRRTASIIAITLRGSKRETGIWDIEQEDLDAHRLGCQINWTPDGRRGLLGAPDRQRRQPSLQHADQGRQAARRTTTIDALTLHRHPGPALARILPAAVGRRQVAGVGRHPARARSRHRRLRDLPVAGRHAAREGGAAHLPLGQRSLARHLRPGRRRPERARAMRPGRKQRPPRAVAVPARRSALERPHAHRRAGGGRLRRLAPGAAARSPACALRDRRRRSRPSTSSRTSAAGRAADRGAHRRRRAARRAHRRRRCWSSR